MIFDTINWSLSGSERKKNKKYMTRWDEEDVKRERERELKNDGNAVMVVTLPVFPLSSSLVPGFRKLV